MRYWDSSAIVPLLVVEDSSTTVEAILAEDGSVVSWWGTPIECASAIGRRDRDGALDASEVALATTKLAALEASWVEVAPSERLRDIARRLVRVHDLRAADALQLAAATAVSAEQDAPLPLVTLDERLALAASREGFPVIGVS